MIKSCILAIQFLTRLPTPHYASVDARDMGRAIGCFPLVGALIGLMLWLAAQMLAGVVAPPVAAALLVALWALITGALHLDGLADMADGWLGGHGDHAQALRIMKDSRLGTGGAVALVVVLLLKWLLVWQALKSGQLWLLALAPVAGRIAAIALMPITRYVSEQGLGEAMHKYLSRPVVALWVAWLLLGIGLGFGWLAVGVLLAVWLWLRWLMIRITGGMTGDTAGAMTEVMEVTILLVLPVALN